MMSSITPNSPQNQPKAPGAPTPSLALRRAPGGFWSFLKTLFVGGAGLAVIGAITAFGGQLWLAANQRAEAEKPQPWADPSFTTTVVTTAGLLARWMDNDGNPENGHSYIQGIYNLWKVRQARSQWQSYTTKDSLVAGLPPLWRVEFTADVKSAQAAHEAEFKRMGAEVAKENRRVGILSASSEGIRQLAEEARASGQGK